MPNADTIGLIFGLVMILLLVLGALWGFLAGIKRELKCLAVFVVVLGLLWVIFGGMSSIDDNIIFGVSGIVKGMFNVPANLQTWREVGLYIGQNSLGFKEILVEGTNTYSLYMNVVSMIVRGCYLMVATIGALALSLIIRLVSHIVELIIQAVKRKKQKNVENASDVVVDIASEKPTKRPKQKLSHRFYGAGVGLLKNILVVVLICAPISALTGIVTNFEDESKDAVEEIMMGANYEGSTIDWLFEVVEALDNNAFVKILNATDGIFGKSLSDSMFDTMFSVETENGVVYLRNEIVKLIDIADIVLPTYDKTQKIPFDIWALSEDELDNLLSALKESALFKAVIPVAFEFAGQMDAVKQLIKEAGLKNLNEFVKLVDWEKDLNAILDLVKQVLLNINLNKPLDVMALDSEALQQMIITLSDTTFFKELMPIVIDIALSLTVVKDFVGELGDVTELKNNLKDLNWQKELVNLIDIYGILQKLNIDLNNLNLNWLVTKINDEASFEVIKEALEKLTAGELFDKVMLPVLDGFINDQLNKNGLTEFEGLFSILKMESSDWNHDLPIVLEMVGILSDMGVLSNNIQINDFESMHQLVDKLFELVILSDQVKVSVDSADLKTLIIEAALRQFKFLDAENMVFEVIELRDELNWDTEKANIHKLINTFERFVLVVNNVQGLNITSIADFGALDFNVLLDTDALWNVVFDLLDSLVDSKLIMSLLPQVFEKFISPILFQMNGEIGGIGLLEGITSENVIAELYNLVYIAMDLRKIDILDANARANFDYKLGATAFIPKDGFYESEYFTYTPNVDDLALVDIIERIFASAILKGREGRLFRLLIKMTLSVDVSVDELLSINYSSNDTRSEKQVLIDGINQLKPILTDPEFSIFTTDEATGAKTLNTNYFLEKDNLMVILDAANMLLDSKIFVYTTPEVYNQLLVPKGVIPADFVEILKVQSTFLGITEGVTAIELNEDVKSILALVKNIANYGVLDILNPEKQRDVRLDNLGNILVEALDVIVGLNIIDGKIDELTYKVLKDLNVNIDTSIFADMDWDFELLRLKEIIKDVQELVILCGFETYGNVLDFMSTAPMDITRFYHPMTIYLLGTISLELYNSQVLYELVYGLVFNKVLVNNETFNKMFHLDNYDPELFKQDLLIITDATYQLIYSDLIPVIGSFMFPTVYGGTYNIDLGKENIAYLLEDILSLNIVNLNLYSLVEMAFTKFGLAYDFADLLGVRLVNDLEYGAKTIWDIPYIDMPNAFSEYNRNLNVADLYYKGDAFKVRELYLALLPVLQGSEFPITDSNKLKGFLQAFNADVINAYKQSEQLNTYALSIADALDIFADMTLGKAMLTPLVKIIDNMNIGIGELKISKLLEFDQEYSKNDLLGDFTVIADVIRDAVGFDLLYILLQDRNIQWIANGSYAQALIEDAFSIKLLDARFEDIFNAIVKMASGNTLQINLASDVALSEDGKKISAAYPYIANIMQNVLAINKLSSLSTLQIDVTKFLYTNVVIDILNVVRNIVPISILEAVLPDLSAKIQTGSLAPAIKELLNLDDITAKELLQAIVDVTYPIEGLLNLNFLDILQKKNISLANMDTVPGYIGEILNNHYITVKYVSLLELVSAMLNVGTDKFDPSTVDWTYEVSQITGILTDVSDIIKNCEFATANDIIRLINNPQNVKEYATDQNVKEIISIIRHVISSQLTKELGMTFYVQSIQPSLANSLAPEMYNLIKIDESYTASKLFSDLELVLQTLEVVLDGDLLEIITQDIEIDYVGLVPTIDTIVTNLFTLDWLSDKITYIYDYIHILIPALDLTYVDYEEIDFVSDAEKISTAYEKMSVMLDSQANPYQRYSQLQNMNLKLNLGGASKEVFVEAIEGIKLINDTTIIIKNTPIILTLMNSSISQITNSENPVGPLMSALFTVPINDAQYKLVTEIVHDDINTLLDILINNFNSGLLDYLADPANYDLTLTYIPNGINSLKELMDLRIMTELNGQNILVEFFKLIGLGDKLDFEKLIYNHEKEVVKNILSVVPEIINETDLRTYNDFANLYTNLLTGALDIKSILTEKNFTNIINILTYLKESEILRQVTIPMYQAIIDGILANNEVYEGLEQFLTINENIYTNDLFISDYCDLVDALVILDEAGLYNVLFNDGIIDWANVEVVEAVLEATIGSYIFMYKEEQLVKSLIHTYSKSIEQIGLINADDIKLSGDIKRLVAAYEALVPVLTMSGFPVDQLSDLNKKVTVYISDFVNDEVAMNAIAALRELSETSVYKGTIPFLAELVKAVAKNEYITEIMSYTNRGLTSSDVIADTRVLFAEGGTLELLIEADVLDLLRGIDINITAKEIYEEIIRDIWNLNILNGEYATIVKLVGAFVQMDLSEMDQTVLNAQTDEELVVALMNDVIKLLESNNITTVVELGNFMKNMNALPDYFTADNIKALNDIVKNAISLTIMEATLPTIMNAFVANNVIPSARDLFTLNDNYNYSDLKADYEKHLYPVIDSLVDFGLVGIMRNNDLIDWDKVKADNVAYLPEMIKNLVTIKYLDAKKDVLYSTFLTQVLPDLDVEAIIMANEGVNFEEFVQELLPVLASDVWPYNTLSDLVKFNVNEVVSRNVLNDSNTKAIIKALRAFEDSILMKETLKPLCNGMIPDLIPWIDFNNVKDEEVLDEYKRLVNIVEKLDEIGFMEETHTNIHTKELTELIDMIFGNETVSPAVIGLSCLVSQGSCMNDLYNFGLLPTVEGISPDIMKITEDMWHQEIIHLRNLIAALGEFSKTNDGVIDLEVILEDFLVSDDVQKLENAFTALNESILYRNILFYVFSQTDKGTLELKLSDWFREQQNSEMASIEEWKSEVIILARLQATLNHLSNFDLNNIDIVNNYENIILGYDNGSDAADPNQTYVLDYNGESAGLRQLYQLLCASKVYDISGELKTSLELILFPPVIPLP